MKDLLITLGLSLTLLAGCTTQEMPEVPALESNLTTVKSGKMLAIERYIDLNHKSITRGEEIPLLPYVVDGDTVMYVANYPGGGFEIFSNDFALPMVLVKSKIGEYEPYAKLVNTPFDDYLSNAAKSIKLRDKITDNDDLDLTWKLFYQINNNYATRAEGYVGQAAEIYVSEYTPKGGRLATKWTQRSPYNQFTPYLPNGNGHFPIGCGGVAVGQYIFHSHTYFNTPVSTVSTAFYDVSSNTFSFSGESSSAWNSIIFKGTSLTAAKSTAIFLGHIAKELPTDYSDANGGNSKQYDYPAVINRYCGQNCRWMPFGTSYLFKILSGGRPALCISTVSAYDENGSKKTDGHAYLIDYAALKNITYYDVFAEKSSNLDDQDDDDLESSYGRPLSYYREKYGAISTRYLGASTEHWIAMNWGWDEDNDNVLINAELTKWKIDHDKYMKTEVYYTDILVEF